MRRRSRPLSGDGAESMQVHSYLACAPRDMGVTAALFYVPRGRTSAGGSRPARACAAPPRSSRWKVITRRGAARFCRSVEDDLRGRWIEQTVPVTTDVRSPIAEADCAELSRLQSAFIREWLFYPGDPQDDDEVAAYRKLGCRCAR